MRANQAIREGSFGYIAGRHCSLQSGDGLTAGLHMSLCTKLGSSSLSHADSSPRLHTAS